ILVGARVLPGPAPAGPIVLAPHAGGVDHRDALGMRLVDQRLEIGHGDPGVLAAGIAPALDRFEDRHGAFVAERVVDVDDQQRRALAESAARAVARGRKHRFVALGKKFVPDGLGHGHVSRLAGCGCSIAQRLARTLSTKLMSMISSYFTSLLRMPASRTTARPVAQASLLIMPSLLHI